MSTAKETREYDRGYEDALDGLKKRRTDGAYARGYAQGQRFAADLPDEAEHRMQLAAIMGW